MNQITLLKESIRALSSAPVRTLLTMLGVIIGVAAVIAMMSIGSGAREETLAQIQSLGAQNLYIKALRLTGESLKHARQSLSQGLTRKDLQVIMEKLPFLSGGTFEMKYSGSLRLGKEKPRVNLLGVGPEYFRVIPSELKFGRFFTGFEFASSAPRVVLGERAALDLFGNRNPVGKVVKIDSQSFEIIGVISNIRRQSQSAKSSSSIKISDRDAQRDVYLPYSAILSRFLLYFQQTEDSEKDPTYSEVSTLILKLRDPKQMGLARDMVRKILDLRHRGIQDYQIVAPMDLLEKSDKVQQIFNLVMVLIAGLSLVVGGIGIMNIMLANIQQRVKEIGIRRAVGATSSDILVQFLLEAVVISVGGGLIGVLTGFMISYGISHFTGWSTLISLSSILVSFFVSVLVGLSFGIFPARRASEMDPIRALRYE
jgi:ABC-type antimicrobial peptide transport system permease subunit